MAKISRILHQTLTHHYRPIPILTTQIRHSSTKPKPNIEILDLDQSPPSDSSSAEVIAFGMKKLEDAIHRIIVRRAAPDWLPFLPGYSYWVPPRASSVNDHASGSVVEVLGRLNSLGNSFANSKRGLGDDDEEEEDMVFSSSKGWPSSAFFIHDGTSPAHPIPIVEVEVKVQDTDDAETSRPKDVKE